MGWGGGDGGWGGESVRGVWFLGGLGGGEKERGGGSVWY